MKHKFILLTWMLMSFVGTVVAQGFEASAEGIGPLKIMMPVSEIPKSIDGLYNRVENKGWYLLLYNGDDEVMRVETSDNNIGSIQAYDNANVFVTINGKHYRLGSDVSSLRQSGKYMFWSTTGSIQISYELSLNLKIKDDHRGWTNILNSIKVSFYDPYDNEP